MTNNEIIDALELGELPPTPYWNLMEVIVKLTKKFDVKKKDDGPLHYHGATFARCVTACGCEQMIRIDRAVPVLRLPIRRPMIARAIDPDEPVVRDAMLTRDFERTTGRHERVEGGTNYVWDYGEIA